MPDSFSGVRLVQEDAFIYTYSGKKAGPLYPPISALDMGISLGRLCRFVGHGQTFYSVLLHSLGVSSLVQKLDRRAALLHDSVEAVMNDPPTPFKTPETQLLERRVQTQIFSKYLTEEEKYSLIMGGHERIKIADEQAFIGEIWVLGSEPFRKLHPHRNKRAEKLVEACLMAYGTDTLKPSSIAVQHFVRSVEN